MPATADVSSRESTERPKLRSLTTPLGLGLTLVIGGVVGLIASFDLSIEKYTLLEDPNAVLSCDFNPFFSCGSVMAFWQSELLGFPNQLIGIMAYVFPLLIGVLMLAGTPLPRWVMVGLNIGLLAGVALIMFLFYSSIYVIGVGCPWCMLVWLVTIPMFVALTSHNALVGNFGSRVADSTAVRVVASMPVTIAGFWLFIIAVCIVIAFQAFFFNLF